MVKVLKVVLGIVLVLVVAIIVLGFVGPKDYDVSKTQKIDAPVTFVYPYLKSLEKGNQWGPWKQQDPDMDVSYEGEDGTVGSSSTWDGEVVGKGKQTVTAITEGHSVETDIIFYSPFGEMHSDGYFEIAPVEGGSEVTWGFKGQNNFVGRVMSAFSDMEANVLPMFEQGLQNLDSLVTHDMNREYNGQTVQYQDIGTRTFMAKRAVVPFEGMQGFYIQNLPRIAAAVGRGGAEMQGMPCGLYYSWDEEAGSTDMAAAIPVSRAVQGRDMEAITVEGGKGLLVDYYGDYEGLGNAHEAIDAYMTNFNLTNTFPVIEEYVTDPSVEPDTAKWLTKIYYLIEN